MSKAKTTSSNAVDPWIPSDSTFNTFKSRADSTITPFFKAAINASGDAIGDARSMPDYAPGVMETAFRAQDPTARSAAFGQLKQNIANDVMQGVNSTFGGSGMTGSSLHQQNLAKGLTEGIAGVENEAFQQGENRALQGADLANTAFGQSFSRDLGVANAYNQFGSTYQGASSGALNSLLSSATGAASQTTTQSQSPGFMGILGAGLQVASLFSDERLKEDEKKVGEMDDGTPIYTFKYREGAAPSPELEGKTMMGVFAQEVKKKKAVQDDPSGFKRVDYGAL